MKIIYAILLVFPTLALADVYPDYERIFTLKKTEKLIPCTKFGEDNYLCDRSLDIYDEKSSIVGKKKALPFTVNGGEGEWHIPVMKVEKAPNNLCYFLVRTEGETSSRVRANCDSLTSINAVLDRYYQGDYELELDFKFNPTLKEVFSHKDGTFPMDLKAMYALSDDPNKIIGTIKLPQKGTSTITFSYPTKGETKLNQREYLQSFNRELPVLKRDGNKYLILVPQVAKVADGSMRGIAISSMFENPKAYTWVQSEGEAFTFTPEAFSKSIDDTKYVMKKGNHFQKDQEIWTSIKVHAMVPDFDRTKQDDFTDPGELLPRKKIFLREVYLPLFNKSETINFWFHWQPGC
jgi:hypothetical protein